MEFTLPNLQREVVLAPYTTYKIGGPADFFVQVNNQDELTETVRQARKASIPYFLLGTGANILIGDKGFHGLVIHNLADGVELRQLATICHSRESGNQDREFTVQALIPGQARNDEVGNVSINPDTEDPTLKEFRPSTLLTVESGATIADLIQLTTKHNLSGLEHFAGIPSSVGGAIWQNLHFLSPDRSRTVFIEEVLHSAKVLLPDNTVRDVGVEFFNFGYDNSILHHQEIIVLEATFKLTPKPKTEILQQAEENLKWRRERQPQLDEFPSCGSVFKKIEGVGAGRLIDQVGLKGRQIGGAQISEKHANFLVNTGNATAADVMALVKLAQETVKKELGYDLEMEIGLVGEF